VITVFECHRSVGRDVTALQCVCFIVSCMCFDNVQMYHSVFFVAVNAIDVAF